jgi:dolichol-phosphate mannosyltransferase
VELARCKSFLYHFLMAENLQLIVVIPAYNEAECIESVINAWLPILGKVNGHLLVVNDGSCDSTESIVMSLAQKHSNISLLTKTNGGHGSAILAGYNWAIQKNPQHIFQMDGDSQFSVDEFWSLWSERNSYSMVIGFRAKRADGFIRNLVTVFLRLFIFTTFQITLKDPNSPFRLFKKPFLENSLQNLKVNYFAPNIFLSIIARYGKNSLKEVPVRHFPRSTGTSSLISFGLMKACLKATFDLLSFRRQFPRGLS